MPTQAVLAGVSEGIPCCVRMARELWQEFSVVDSFATGSKQSLDAMDFGLASSVRQQNLGQALGPVAKNAEPNPNTCPLRVK